MTTKPADPAASEREQPLVGRAEWSTSVMPHRVVIYEGDSVVAEVIEGDRGKDWQAKNATLIADAPKMLAIIEELTDHMVLHPGNWRAREKAEDVRNQAIDFLNKHGG